MTETRDEYEFRRRAIQLHQEGLGFEVILQRLGRGRSWLSKWLRRYREEGWAGLRSRSRAPQRQPRRTPERVVARVAEIREELEQSQTRRSRFAGVGAEVVQLELQRRRIHPLPSLSTIERILRQHGYPKRVARRRKGGSEPYPTPRIRFPGDLQQTDLVGPRHLRGPQGVTRF
jgi:transposase